MARALEPVHRYHRDDEIMPTAPIELEEDISHEAVPEGNISQLKPVDGGRDAWQLLIAAFIFEALFWGFPTSFGIFQAYYSSLPQFQKDSSKIPVIGTLAQGLCFMVAPLATATTKRFRAYRTRQILLAWPITILALLTASFCNTVPGLIATQGVMYGLGFVFLTFPILDMINEWWIARKGMAFGMISAASGLTGIVMPFILETLLQRFGYKNTLRACAIAMLILTAPLVPLLKGRLPASEQAQQPKTDWSFLKRPLFWFYAAATVIQGFGFFIPPTFISSYAVLVGLSHGQSALLLALMALAQTLGQFAFGWLSDTRLPISLLTSTCCAVAAVATATLWGLGRSLGVLVLYSLVYGFFAYGFATMRVAMGRAVTSEQSAVLATFSTFVFLQGIGNVMIGPVVAALSSRTVDLSAYAAARYKGPVVFVAASSMLGAMVIVVPHAYKTCISMPR